MTTYALDPDGTGVTLHVFINAPYDKYVSDKTRFWRASGVDVSLGATGVTVNAESVVSILIGGLAFQDPLATGEKTGDQGEASAQREFQLFSDRAEAMKRHDNIVDTYVFNFKESVRGLSVGAAVDFRGIVVGEVAAIYTRFDPVTKQFSIPVEIHFFPERFTSRFESGGKGGRLATDRRQLAQTLVERGLRGQLRTGNLLTGQLYIALDFFPSAPKAMLEWDKSPPELPTMPGNLQGLQDSITSLIAKLNKIPFEGIGKDLKKTLADAGNLLNTLNTQVAPEAKSTLAAARATLDSANTALQPDSAVARSTVDTMRELSRTAASFRTLADYLERHPEALIRGKTEDQK